MPVEKLYSHLTKRGISSTYQEEHSLYTLTFPHSIAQKSYHKPTK